MEVKSNDSSEKVVNNSVETVETDGGSIENIKLKAGEAAHEKKRAPEKDHHTCAAIGR